jgi:hypothetical protein
MNILPKTDVRYWRDRVFKPVSVRPGGLKVTGRHFAVKLQYSGKRMTLGLYTGNREEASQKARRIYLDLVSGGWNTLLEKHRPNHSDAGNALKKTSPFKETPILLPASGFCVYLIQSAGFIKIGKSSHLRKRMASYRTNNPDQRLLGIRTFTTSSNRNLLSLKCTNASRCTSKMGLNGAAITPISRGHLPKRITEAN